MAEYFKDNVADMDKEQYENWLLERFEASGVKPNGAPLSREEKIEMARSFLMTDNEFGTETVGRGGPSLAEHMTQDNIDKVSTVVTDLPEHLDQRGVEVGYGRAGQFLPDYASAKELETKVLEKETKVEGNWYPSEIVNDKGLEEGGIALFASEGMSGDTAAHEFMHLRDQEEGKRHGPAAHLDIYAELGHRARNDAEFDDTVRKLIYFQNKGAYISPQELEDMMPEYRKRMKEMIKNRDFED